MQGESVMMVGGPFDGHRIVVDTSNGPRYEVVTHQPLDANANQIDESDPFGFIRITKGWYDLQRLPTRLDTKVLWVGIYQGEEK